MLVKMPKRIALSFRSAAGRPSPVGGGSVILSRLNRPCLAGARAALADGTPRPAKESTMRQSGYVREDGLGWLRPEHRDDFLRSLRGFRGMTMEDLGRNERLCGGSPAEVRDALIGLGEALGSNVLLLPFNQGAMPHDMFLNRIRRFAAEVMPDVARHAVTAMAGA
jgi:hypothetical protein